MKFIGIDLAWTYKNETGICIFEDKTCVFLDAKVYSDEDIIAIIEANKPCVVSIDAPLVVENETGGRSVDSLLMKTAIHGKYLKLYATSRAYMMRVFKAIRGETLRLSLENRGFVLGDNLMETFPTGIYLSLFPDRFDSRYKISSRQSLEILLKNATMLINNIRLLGFQLEMDLNVSTKKAYKLYEDQIDGVLCALMSYYLYHDQYQIWSDKSGLIGLPKL